MPISRRATSSRAAIRVCGPRNVSTREKNKAGPCRFWNIRTYIFDQHDHMLDTERAAACHDPVLREVTADGIDDLGALFHKHVAGSEHHGQSMLCLTLDGHEAHGRALRRFEIANVSA
jgi:hypothetical protein